MQLFNAGSLQPCLFTVRHFRRSGLSKTGIQPVAFLIQPTSRVLDWGRVGKIAKGNKGGSYAVYSENTMCC